MIGPALMDCHSEKPVYTQSVVQNQLISGKAIPREDAVHISTPKKYQESHADAQLKKNTSPSSFLSHFADIQSFFTEIVTALLFIKRSKLFKNKITSLPKFLESAPVSVEFTRPTSDLA